MAKMLVAANWLQLPGGNFFVIHFCSFDREWDGFRYEFVTRDWIEAAHVLRVILPEETLGSAIEQLKNQGEAVLLTTSSERVAVLGFSPTQSVSRDVPNWEGPRENMPVTSGR